MKARIIKSIIDTGSAARDYIRLVCGLETQSRVRMVMKMRHGKGPLKHP